MQAAIGPNGRAASRTAGVFFLCGALVAPLTIVLHELGHFCIGLVLGTPDLALHYGSVSDRAKETGFSQLRIGIQALAGPVVTLLIMGASILALRKWPENPFWITALLAAPIRFAVGLVYLYFAAMAAIQGIPPGQPNFDEFKAAEALGFRVEPLLIAELALTVCLWWWAVRRIGQARRIPALTGALTGIFFGIGIWISIVGPWLLP